MHYGMELPALAPPGARRALDVGCGEGWLARELAGRIPQVVGIDPDRDSIERARAAGAMAGLEYVETDLLGSGLALGSFDLVTCVAALHHMDEGVALARMAELVRPGGALGVVGLARSRIPADAPWDVAAVVASRALSLVRPHWETPAPKIWPPPHTYPEMRDLSAAVLPGRRFRRRLMFRYSLTWTRPPGAPR